MCLTHDSAVPSWVPEECRVFPAPQQGQRGRGDGGVPKTPGWEGSLCSNFMHRDKGPSLAEKESLRSCTLYARV